MTEQFIFDSESGQGAFFPDERLNGPNDGKSIDQIAEDIANNAEDRRRRIEAIENAAEEVDSNQTWHDVREYLGFIPDTTPERQKAGWFMPEYLRDSEHGVGRKLSYITKNEKGGQARATASVVRNEIIRPITQSKAAITHLYEFSSDLNLSVERDEEIGTIPEVSLRHLQMYYDAKSKFSVSPEEQDNVPGFDEFLNEADITDVRELTHEAIANAELRLKFWQKMAESARSNMQAKAIIDKELGILV